MPEEAERAASAPETPAITPEDSAPRRGSRPRRGVVGGSAETARPSTTARPAHGESPRRPRHATPPATASAAPQAHALFLPPDVEGSLSNTWTMRAIRDDEPPTGTRPAWGERSEIYRPADHDEQEGLDPQGDDTERGTTHDGPATPFRLVRQLLPWSALALVAAVIVGSIVLVTTRPVPTANNQPSAVGSTRASLVSTADLLTPSAAGAFADGSWQIAKTETALTVQSAQVACFSQPATGPTPLGTVQRTLSSNTSAKTAALHRIDGYQTQQVAHSAFQAASLDLGMCDQLPLHLVRADAVSGLGDEALSVTVADQEEKATTYHTILVVRTGKVVNTYDVAQNGQAVKAASLADAARASVGQQCSRADGACATAPTVSASAPPAGDPVGWLGVTDLPRITPGQGSWTTTDPGTVAATATQCEGMSLATVSGPRDRQQRTYLLTQDAVAPTSFGLDQLTFDFADADAATRFADKLSDNLAACTKKLATAKVSDKHTFSLEGSKTGVGQVKGTTLLIEQKTGAHSSAFYRVSVVRRESTVIYLMSNPSRTFGFTAQQMQDLAVRAAQRSAEK